MNEALWALGRGTGVSALVLLTVSTALGLLLSGGLRHRELPRFALTEIHRRASLAATGFLLVHMLSLLLDTESQLRLVNLVVPFLGEQNPLWWGLGTLGFDLLLVVVVSSLLRRHLSHRTWRSLHLLSYAMWPVAFLHSVAGGTDAGTTWLRFTAIVCAAAVGAALGYRLLHGAGTTGATVVARPRAAAPAPREFLSTGPLVKAETVELEPVATHPLPVDRPGAGRLTR